MILRHPRRDLALALSAVLTFQSVASAQLGLGLARQNKYEHQMRAQRFQANRTVEMTIRNRLRERSFLIGRSGYLDAGVGQRSLLFSPQFGFSGQLLDPTDRAGRSLRHLQMLDVKSDYARHIINMPRPSDFRIGDTLSWSVEDVMAAERANRSTGLVFPTETNAATDHETSPASRTDAYFDRGTAAFRAALAEDDAVIRANLMADAHDAFDIMTQIDIDAPRGYLALAITQYAQENYNTALMHLVMGLKRADSLAEADIGRERFYDDDEAWQRLLDTLNLDARSVNNARLILLYSYFLFLNGDYQTARTQAEQAKKLLEDAIQQTTRDEGAEALEEAEKRIDYARRFSDMLGEKLKAPTEAGVR